MYKLVLFKKDIKNLKNYRRRNRNIKKRKKCE